MTRKLVSVPALLSLVIATVMILGTPASAAVSFAKGTLTITGTSGDDVFDVDCGAGKVIVPAATGVDCNKVRHIVADLGKGDDQIAFDMMFVPSAEWDRLQDTTTYGGPGFDVVTGSGIRDRFYGQGYTDRFNSVAGNDLFVGGPGWNIVDETCDCDMTLGGDTLSFSTGDQIKMSGVKELYLDGGPSPNVVNLAGWTGESLISTAAGDDQITGGSGKDDITAGAGIDDVAARKGDDQITVEEGVLSPDTYDGGPGDDLIFGGTLSANSVLTPTTLSGYGNDTLASIERADLRRSTPGSIDASAFNGPVVLTGTSGIDTLIGGSGDDVFDGNIGADALDGNDGTDYAKASTGGNSTLTDALLTSTTGNKALEQIESVTIEGASGNGGGYDVSAFSGPVNVWDYGGNDVIIGNGQTNLFAGALTPGVSFTAPLLVGSGRTMNLTDVSSVGFFMGGPGAVDLTTFPGRVTIYGSSGDDQIKTGPGKDSVFGADGNDRLLGGAGRDELRGGAGRDFVNGQAGRDKCSHLPGKGRLKSCEVVLEPLPTK